MDNVTPKVGLHFHLRIGPEEVSIYDQPRVAGPYYNITYDSMDDAHTAFVCMIQEFFPTFLDESDFTASYIDFEEMVEYFEDEEWCEYDLQEYGASQSFEKDGVLLDLTICNGCRPIGMN